MKLKKRLLKLAVVIVLVVFVHSQLRSLMHIYHDRSLHKLCVDCKSPMSIFKDSYQNKLYFKYKRYPTDSQESSFYSIDNNTSHLNKNTYLILEYTKFGRSSKYCHLNQGGDTFDYLDDCNYQNCVFTCDKSMSNKADALLFHESNLYKEFDEVEESLKSFSRQQSQRWILWNDEANLVQSSLDKFMFNWTISYKSNSQASYCAYGCYVQNKQVLNDTDFAQMVRKNFESRQANSVWFVSNCKSIFRNVFAAKLSNFTSVSMFGKCAKEFKSLNVKTNVFNETLCERNSRCETDVFEGNKFFLALENQNCSDYITEKFWRTLSFDMIPVVVQPSKAYYEKIAPPNSYIHVADFGYDLKKTGAYLNRVATELDLYFKYFKWKQFYSIGFGSKFAEKMRMCELCFQLNTKKANSYYLNVSTYFNSGCNRNLGIVN